VCVCVFVCVLFILTKWKTKRGIL